MKLIGIVGTNADFSFNRILLQYMARHFEDQVEIEVFEVKEVPLFDKPASGEIPQIIKELEDKIQAADGVIFSTPEYDHAIPAVLSAVVEWLSFSPKKVLTNKPTLIVGASYGTLGSSRAQQNMRDILQAPEVKAATMPAQEYLLGQVADAFDDQGNLIRDGKAQELDDLMAEFLNFAKIFNEAFAQGK